jgi:membrane-bound metal-dependent hydrolase YbcI (DUF457 family)
VANYKGHITGGLVAGAVYVAVVSFAPIERLAESAGLLGNWQVVAALFVVSMLFALIPDVDTNSKAQDIFFGIAFPLDILLIWQGYLQAAAYLGLIAMLPIIGHHRGWTHKKWAAFAIPLPILLIPYLYNDRIFPISTVFYGGAVVGYLSHLLLDGLLWKRFRIKG